MHLRLLALCIAAASALVAGAPGRSPAPANAPGTYCNPSPIPNYPVGRNVRDARLGDKTDGSFLWFVDRVEQYRELADVSVLWHEGAWFCTPRWTWRGSATTGATWQHHPLNVRDVGYAPTVVHKAAGSC